MIHLQRKVKMKYTGSDEYLPQGVPREKFIPVIGYESRKVEKTYEGKQKTSEEIFYFVLNDNGKMTRIAEFNCVTMIDEQAELNVDRAVQMAQNLTTSVKLITETYAKSREK